MIAIEVDPKAKQDVLDLDLGWSSCGLGYAQRSGYPEIQVSTICGNVKDSIGAVVSNAQVMLMASGEGSDILEHTQSGTIGEFVLDQPENGTYQLLIKSSGFRPFLQVIHVEAGGATHGCKQPIRVRLDVIF
jgi:hypothetical protein